MPFYLFISHNIIYHIILYSSILGQTLQLTVAPSAVWAQTYLLLIKHLQ